MLNRQRTTVKLSHEAHSSTLLLNHNHFAAPRLAGVIATCADSAGNGNSNRSQEEHQHFTTTPRLEHTLCTSFHGIRVCEISVPQL